MKTTKPKVGHLVRISEDYPNTHLRLLRAMIRAAHWLDENNNANREEAVKILARPSYVGADEAVIAIFMWNFTLRAFFDMDN